MKIDARKLKETIIKKVRKIAENERFYEVPNAKDYILSDYGRLFYKGKLQKPVYVNGEGLYNEYYHIQFDNTIYAGLIRIDRLIALTFRPDEKIGTLINPHRTNDKFKWRVIDLHIVRNKGEMVNYIQSKIDGVTPTYKGAGEKHGFINRIEYSRGIRRTIQSSYFSAKGRATNKGFKKRNPQYEDVTMCDEWLNSSKAYADWFITNDYYYPEPLELDKDLITFGIGKIYSPETCCRLPHHINRLFSSKANKLGSKIQRKKHLDGTYVYWYHDEKNGNIYNNYLDALRQMRKDKAEQIRKAVKEEREKGYMPEYLLEKMSQWADLTEMGLIKMWEPDMKKLIEEGII